MIVPDLLPLWDRRSLEMTATVLVPREELSLPLPLPLPLLLEAALSAGLGVRAELLTPLLCSSFSLSRSSCPLSWHWAKEAKSLASGLC